MIHINPYSFLLKSQNEIYVIYKTPILWNLNFFAFQELLGTDFGKESSKPFTRAPDLQLGPNLGSVLVL